MNDDNERELAYKLRQILTQGTETIDAGTLARLHQARTRALAGGTAAVGGLRLAGTGHLINETLLRHGRMAIALATLLAGAAMASYWNNYVLADDNEEIDSALLADDLPINAYLDPGFHAWLERNAPSASQ